MRLLKALGYLPWDVEKVIPGTYKKRDLWNFVDIIAGHPVHGLLLVQATSDSNISARVRKVEGIDEALEFPILRSLLAHDVKVQVWGWSLRGPLKNKKTWHLRRIAFKELDGAIYTNQIGRAEEAEGLKELTG